MKIYHFILPSLFLSTPALAITYSVQAGADGAANIFASGLSGTSSSGGGFLPTEIAIPAGLERSMTVRDVFGSTHNAGGSPTWGPDGFSFTTVNINPKGGISGLYSGRAMALLGVFLGPEGQPASAPATIDFTSGTGITRNFYSLAPENGQVFLIGDGWASTTDQQIFYIPDNASRLFIGFADAGGFTGNPSNFSDNTGNLTGSFTFEVPISVPEPGAPFLAGAAVLTMAGRRKRKTLRITGPEGKKPANLPPQAGRGQEPPRGRFLGRDLSEYPCTAPHMRSSAG